MTKQLVFYVSLQYPWRPILELEAEIISGKKFTWAKLPNGKRALLGASAFFMRRSAMHRKLRALNQTAMTPVFVDGGRRSGQARSILQNYARTGELL